MTLVVTAVRATFEPGACRAHRGAYRIALTVDGQGLGDASRVFADGVHRLEPDDWRHELPDDATRLRIQCHANDEDCWNETVTRVFSSPFPPRLTLGGANWSVRIETRGGRMARQPAGRPHVTRSTPSRSHTTTVLAPPARMRFELDPVIPFPVRSAERREAWTHWLVPDYVRRDLIPDRYDQPQNVNPAVVVRSAAPGWVATVAFTRIWAPGYVASDLGGGVTWRPRSIAGDAQAEIVGRDRGLSVHVRATGTADGEAAVDAYMGGRRVATHRFLVRAPVSIPIRFTYYSVPERLRHLPRNQMTPNMQRRSPPDVGYTATEPFEPGRSQSLIGAANGYWRSIGVQLVPDPDPRHEQGFSPIVGEPASFRRQASSLDEVFVEDRLLGELVRRNGLDDVVHVAMVCEARAGMGVTALPALASPAEVGDDGSPSSSWVEPSGVPPETSATRQVIQRFDRHPYPAYLEACGGSVARRYGCVFGRPFSGRSGKTLAHELGHVFGLCHRGLAFDGLPDATENLMADGGGKGDLDILQARVVWDSGLVRAWYRR